MTKKTKLLLLGCTHGNEKVGMRIFENYQNGENQNYVWSSQIGNPLAFEQNVRYVEQDLNRSFPGKIEGKYEEKRAFELVKLFEKQDVVIDFHQTFADMESCIITSNLNKSITELMYYFDIKNVVLLSNSFDNGKNTVADWCNGFGIEYPRTKSAQSDYEIAQKDIENLLNKTQTYPDKTVYEMQTRVDKLTKVKLNLGWKNWKLVSQADIETLGLDKNLEYYPIFIGEVAYGDTYAVLVSRKGGLNGVLGVR